MKFYGPMRDVEYDEEGKSKVKGENSALGQKSKVTD